MSETIIGMFDQDQQAQEIVPLLMSKGVQQGSIDLIRGRDQSSSSDLISRLSQLGVSDAQLRDCYIEGIGRGATLLAAHIPDQGDADQAARIMREHGASDCASSAAARGEGVARLAVVEEELRVGKRTVETGGMRVRQDVSEHPVEAQVNLREEHVNVERRPVNRPLSDAERDSAFKDQTIEATERAEQAVVQKTGRVVEEVTLSKDVDEHTETVRDNVRRTDVKVEKVDPDRKPRSN